MARNFLLDEGISTDRTASYEAAGCLVDHGSAPLWSQQHDVYLETHVFPPRPDDGPPDFLDPADLVSCGETFRSFDTASPFLVVDTRVSLLWVVTIRQISENRSLSAAAFEALAGAVAEKVATQEQIQTLDRALAEWANTLRMRPVFAALSQDVEELFKTTPGEDTPGWADSLRDRLGLLHLNPGDRTTPIAIAVFRYPVSDIPRLKGLPRGTKPLVPPTVLDGEHSHAFCPAPRGSLTGHTVDLSRRGLDPRREVLHPAFDFRARHLFRVGTIRQPVDESILPEARGLHLLAVRETSGRTEYARETDGDVCGD